MKASGHERKSTNLITKNGLGCNKPESIKTTKQKRKISGKKGSDLGVQLINSRSHHVKIQDAQTCFSETALGDFDSVQGRLQGSCGKIKLQLFPVDEDTRKILEQDNHNPYLELTLSTRKKISSVLKHLNGKWGNSKLASGTLMLFPYDVCLSNLVNSRRWTSFDSATTTADVHASLGSPAIFRLRYGWFSILEQTASLASSVPTCSDILKSNNDHGKTITNCDKLLYSLPSEEHEGYHMDGSAKEGVQTPFSSERTVKNEVDQKDGRTVNSSWVDCLSNMSFGALLSEISDAPAINHCQPFSAQNSCLQQPLLTCDSFDAAIASFVAKHESPNPSTRISHSILEAEETCHAFAFSKVTSSGHKNLASSKLIPPAIVRSNYTLGSPVERELSHKVSCAPSTNLENHGQIDGCLEHQSGSQSHSQDRTVEDLDARSEFQIEDPHNASNQFGGMNLTLPDSLGPLELVAPCSKDTNGGETIALEGLVASSMDAFQNFSIF